MNKYEYIVSLHIDLNEKTGAEADCISGTLGISPTHLIINKDEKRASRWILEKEGIELSDVVNDLCQVLASRKHALRELAESFGIAIKCGVLYAGTIIAPAFRISSEAISALSVLDLPIVFQIMPCEVEPEKVEDDDR